MHTFHSAPHRYPGHTLTKSCHSLISRLVPAILALTILLGLTAPDSRAQERIQTTEQTARFTAPGASGNGVKIYNIHGNISVEGYEGDEVQLTARRELSGTDAEVRRAARELKLRMEQRGDNIFIYLDAPFITTRWEDDELHYNINRDGDDYEFLYDLTIRVPRQVHLKASTINNGRVTVRDVRQTVKAFNVNGGITLDGIAGATTAHTVNGDITVRYVQSPRQDSDYQTINGTIEASYPADLSADIRFRSMHGDLYTDFENIERLQARVNTTGSRNREGVRYKVDRFSPIRIGAGGPTFRFEVLNGDVYIRRIPS